MRLDGAGLVDRDRPLRFRFDGREVAAFEGDTVASALLANGIRLVGRSFKYHRPRGIVSAGSDEPNALVTVGEGPDRRPNLRATVEEAADGLDVRSQNRWPSLRHDLLAVNDRLSRFLPAGFYYKTFMWPRSFWERVYEPLIRRAAGLGALSGEAAPDEGEKVYAHCDLLVVGGGPAGLMAALTAGRAGVDVILADEDFRLGGRLLAERLEIDGEPAVAWADRAVSELRSLPNVRVMPRTAVTGVYDQGTYAAIEREAVPCFWRIVAGRAILASGALERGIAFPDNDRPGVMHAGAVRSYVNRWGVVPGRRVAVFGATSDVARTVRDLRNCGIEVVAEVDARKGAEVVATRGRAELSEIVVSDCGVERRIAADCLAVTGGWNPAVHLTCHMNARPVWQDAIAAFVPAENAVPGLAPVGAARGIFDTAGCMRDGAEAARAALAELGLRVPAADVPAVTGDIPYEISPVWQAGGKGRAWLDMQNDVTSKDIRLAAQENFRSVEHMKRYTTQGMATDQGKGSNVTALAILADATGRTIPQTGTTTFRPPYVPVPIMAMGAGAGGKGFAPECFTAAHGSAVALGAPMIEAGLWHRASHFPRPGDATWRDACDREVVAVRQAAGVADVSTLGKIDVQGPDAAEFLDFVYSNMISTLPVGRVRYGVMLREDGMVMDDGTVARMASERFLVTTTTAAAGQVLAHFQFVAQCLRPGLRLRFVPVTDHWAQYAVTGPLASDVLTAVLTRFDAADWAFMSCGAVAIGGVEGRLFRISFSGEIGYEIAVPARYGASLFDRLVAAAREVGGGPYGIEALNVLRIEKGFVTHAEIDGRTTADDLGLGRMVSAAKDCIGKTMSQRPALIGPGRHQLVSLRPVDPGAVLTAGGFLFADGAEATRDNAQGHTTSACHSPTVGNALALALLKDGRSRHGETLRFVDHLRRVEARVTVGEPATYDPEGGRMRG